MTPTLAWVALIASGLVDVALGAGDEEGRRVREPAVAGNLARAAGDLDVCNPPTLCLRHKGRGDAAVRSVSWIEGRRSR
jgi:hypothetical protein